MVKNTITILLLAFFVGSGNLVAQDSGMEVLNTVEKKLMDTDYVAMDFTLEILIPESPAYKIDGNFIKSGQKFKMTSRELDVISDGQASWTINKAESIGYINSVEEDVQFSPLTLVQDYDKSAYEYNLISEYELDGKNYQAIVLKPKDRNADYTKLRFLVDKDSNLHNLFILSRSGERTTLSIKTIQYNGTADRDLFDFNQADYPGINIEDLRLD